MSITNLYLFISILCLRIAVLKMWPCPLPICICCKQPPDSRKCRFNLKATHVVTHVVYHIPTLVSYKRGTLLPWQSLPNLVLHREETFIKSYDQLSSVLLRFLGDGVWYVSWISPHDTILAWWNGCRCCRENVSAPSRSRTATEKHWYRCFYLRATRRRI